VSMAGGSSRFQSWKTARFFQTSLSPSSLLPQPQQEMTTSKSSGLKSAMASEAKPEMSTPASFMTVMAPSLTAVPPTMPAEATPTEELPRSDRSQPSAICERQELWLQRNMTFVLYAGPHVTFTDSRSFMTLALVSSRTRR